MATKTKSKVEPIKVPEPDPPVPVEVEPAVPAGLPAPAVGSAQLYTFGEAAPYLRLGESTLRRLVSRGIVARHFVTRIGGKLFMTGDQILRLIADGQTVDIKARNGARGDHNRRRKAA